MDKRFIFRRVSRFVALVALSAIVVGMLPGRSLAADAAAYTSPSYGFSISWDDRVWTYDEGVLPADSEGVQLDASSSWAMINGVAWPDVDPKACLAQLKDGWASAKSTSDFRKASRSLALPDSPLGGERNLFTMTVTASDGPAQLMLYTECVGIDDDQAALMVSLIAPVEEYKTELPGWDNLLAGIDLEDAVSTTGRDQTEDDSDDDPGRSVYEDPAGFTIAYDAAIWTGKPWEDNSGTGIEFDDARTFGYVKAMQISGTLDECPGGVAYELESNPSFKMVRKAGDSLARPEAMDDAAGELYTMNAASATNRFVVYIECRPLSADSVVLITLFAEASDYETELPVWQDLLNGVRIDDSSDKHDPPAGSASGSLGKQD